MPAAIVQDYEAGDDLGDPTDPNELIARSLTDKLAKLVTLGEEAMMRGDSEVDLNAFYAKRGNYLDLLENPEVAEFMDHMRKQNRAPFMRFGVGS